jgi:hypothetical protein
MSYGHINCEPDDEQVDEYRTTERHRHTPVPSSVDRDGVPYYIEQCSKCGVYAPRRTGICSGSNRTLDEFDDHSDGEGEDKDEDDGTDFDSSIDARLAEVAA